MTGVPPHTISRSEREYAVGLREWSAKARARDHRDEFLSALHQKVPLGTTSVFVDLGCGTGDLMREVRRRFHSRVRGVEPNRYLAMAPSMPTCRLRSIEEITELDLAGATHVVLHHVLGHLKSPLEALCRVAMYLPPTAVLAVVVPNHVFHWVTVVRRHRMGYRHDPTIRHLFYRRTVRQLLTVAGFGGPQFFGLGDRMFGVRSSFGVVANLDKR